MRTLIPKLIKVEVVKCDFCGTEQVPGIIIGGCSVCGLDVCPNHEFPEDACCEDGLLCPNCSKKYRFEHECECGVDVDEHEDYCDGIAGGVGVVDRQTGKHVEAPYL